MHRLQPLQLSEPESSFPSLILSNLSHIFQRYSFSKVYYLNLRVSYGRGGVGDSPLHGNILFGVNTSDLS